MGRLHALPSYRFVPSEPPVPFWPKSHDDHAHEIIHGARGFLTRRKPRIIALEISSAEWRQRGHRVSSVLSKVMDLGYELFPASNSYSGFHVGSAVRKEDLMKFETTISSFDTADVSFSRSTQ